jgi:hypothetical protein
MQHVTAAVVNSMALATDIPSTKLDHDNSQRRQVAHLTSYQ